MWWQDRLPALLSLLFVLGLLSVPGLIIESMYRLCAETSVYPLFIERVTSTKALGPALTLLTVKRQKKVCWTCLQNRLIHKAVQIRAEKLPFAVCHQLSGKIKSLTLNETSSANGSNDSEGNLALLAVLSWRWKRRGEIRAAARRSYLCFYCGSTQDAQSHDHP